MTTATTAQSNTTYSEAEIAILQNHLDWYRNLPEATSLKAFSLEHRVPGERETCELLASKGLIETSPIKAKEMTESVSAKSIEEGRQKVLERLGTLEGVAESPPIDHFRSWSFKWVDRVLLPGAQATVTDQGAEEIVRLYKEGQLKRNDW